ncbi:MAG: amidase [Halapricum sp.]
MKESEHQQTIRRQAARLGFDVTERTIHQILEAAEPLESAASEVGGLDDERRTGVVEPSGGHDELLARYDTPRQRQSEGVLADTTVAVKDNIAVDGLLMTSGSAALGVDPGVDAVVVDRLLDAGVRLVGKANQDAFAIGPSGEFSDYGTVTNPVDASLVPGGSSSGSGAAVAAGTVDVALGSDTGGSVRIPAACCGVVGAKPTHGLVPRHGFLGFAPSLDTIGALARTVDDAAATLTTISGPDPRDPTTDRGAAAEPETAFEAEGTETVGLPTAFFERAEDAVAETVREAVAASPLTAIEVDLPLGAIEQAYFLVGATEFVWYLDQCGTVRGEGFDYSGAIHDLVARIREADLSEHIAKRILPAAFLDEETGGEAYLAGRDEAIRFGDRLTDAFEDVDALVLPTIRTRPPGFDEMNTMDEMLDLLGNTAPFNLAGTPAASVPVGTLDGAPVSAQAVAPRYHDFRALSVAASLVEESSL